MGLDFTSLKPYVLLLYGSFGVACLCFAEASGQQVLAMPRRIAGKRFPLVEALVVCATVLTWLYFAAGSYLLLEAAIIAAIVFLARPRSWTTPATLFGGLSTAVLVLSLAWWRIAPSIAAPLPLAVYAALLVALMFGLSDAGRSPRRLVPVWVALFLAAGVAMLVDLGAFRPGHTAAVFLVHHWGAFIGPALHVRAGLVPFVDVPLQYGLGPTLALAATCTGSDCWTGAHVLFAGTDLAAGALVLAMALATRTRRAWPWIASVTIVVFAAVFFWAGCPGEGNIVVATPSVGGMRFLPVTVIGALWFFERPKAAAIAMVPALLWSPESAAMSVTVFGLCATALIGFRKATLATGALLFGCYATLFLVHRAIYGVWIDPLALLEYVIHVPGPLPINPFSDILLLAATLGLGGWLVFTSAGDVAAKRRDLAVTALLFAVASYSFGRSHPNNICNLAPFLVLVGLRALDRPTDAVGKAVQLGLAVSVAALVFSTWNVVPFNPHVVTDIHEVVAGFPAWEPDVARIRAQIPAAPALGIADFGPHYARHPAETVVWTPMDPSSLWSFVPSARRQVYIERSARRLGRSGWGIFTPHQLMFLDDLQAAYKVTNRRTVQGAPVNAGEGPTTYTVACFDPKPAVVAKTVGPACPPEGDRSAPAP